MKIVLCISCYEKDYEYSINLLDTQTEDYEIYDVFDDEM